MSEQRPRTPRQERPPGERDKARTRGSSNHDRRARPQRQAVTIPKEQASNNVRSQDAEQCEESDARHFAFPDLRGNHLERDPDDVNRSRLTVIFRGPMHVSLRWLQCGLLVTRTYPTWRLYSTMRTAMGCYVLPGEHMFSEEQEEMYVECSSGVNGRPRHRWHESDLERQASSWTTVAVWR